jgi:hypothetical protein
MIVEIDELVAGDTVPPSLEDDRPNQLERRLPVMIATHSGLNRSVEQAIETGIARVGAGAALNFLAIPLPDSIEACHRSAEDCEVVLGGWRRVHQIQNQQNVAAPALAGRTGWLCWLNGSPLLDHEPGKPGAEHKAIGGPGTAVLGDLERNLGSG